MKISQKIKNNKLVYMFYKILFYFELGKNQIARFYQFIPDIIIILGGLKFLFGIELNNQQMVMVFIIISISFIGIGYFMKHSGLWDTDVYIQFEKNPANKELLEAARKINEDKRKW